MLTLERVAIAGTGGQGVLLIGRILAQVAMRHVAHVTCFPSYGAEVRGGTSSCQIILSAKEIASPVAEQCDTLILMDQASLDRFRAQVAGASLVLLNHSMCESELPKNSVLVMASDLANELGDVRAANFVMLGAYLAARHAVPEAEMEAAIEQVLARKNPSLLELNISAFRLGLTQSTRQP